jgi:murein DD-endopeptidase MepM/ murein hydrolase activator NlpD
VNFNKLKSLLLKLTLHLFLLIIFSNCSSTNRQESFTPIEEKIVLDNFGFIADSFDVEKGTVEKNETLADIMMASNIDYLLITEIFDKSKPIFDFRRIQPKKNYYLYKNRDSLNSLHAFIYEINKIKFVKVDLTDSISTTIVERDIEIRERTISGTINSSLYETLSDQNASIVLAGELAEIFAWQIDFYTIQKGDQFFAVYEQLLVDNIHVGIGDILTAKFIHKGNPFNAYLFVQDEKKEYFDQEGKSLQKKFLKAPLKYRRISSGYSGRRLHPILRVYKPHRGIDYAAAVGTPVQAVGDGIVLSVGNNGAAGKMVKIRHNSVYTSAYLHLSGYGKSIRSGVKVKQGQVIGYVGSTGRSTGPHLDFRFWKNGTLVNYLTQKFPSSKSVADSNMNSFLTIKDSLKIKLNSIESAAI